MLGPENLGSTSCYGLILLARAVFLPVEPAAQILVEPAAEPVAAKGRAAQATVVPILLRPLADRVLPFRRPA